MLTKVAQCKFVSRILKTAQPSRVLRGGLFMVWTLPRPRHSETKGPLLKTSVPGPRTRSWVDLARYECPAITARRARRAEESGVPQDPIVWERAQGSLIWDVDGNRYVDLSGAFAVASVGHAHPAVVEAARSQSERLIHAMGDVFPSREKIELCRRLAEVTPGDLQHVILAQSGASAVEAALKTAVVATGKPGVIAFEGAYHGLSYGALEATAYRRSFRVPFWGQFGGYVTHLPYPGGDGLWGHDEASVQGSLRQIEHLLTYPASGAGPIGAVIVEPIQGRGGEVSPPSSWLRGLRALCDRHGLVLIADEIYTGFGRTGRWFACEHAGIVPDVMCVGKAMGGGFPISAAIGRPQVMRAWGDSRGEAIHTSTFLGNPLGCAMALAAIGVLEREHLVTRCASLGAWLHGELLGLQRRLGARVGKVRGRGLMLGLPLLDTSGKPDGMGGLRVAQEMLRRGYILLPSGVYGHVLGFSPPLVIEREQLQEALVALEEVLKGTLIS